jgi:hypothetical protein
MEVKMIKYKISPLSNCSSQKRLRCRLHILVHLKFPTNFLNEGQKGEKEMKEKVGRQKPKDKMATDGACSCLKNYPLKSNLMFSASSCFLWQHWISMG